ncbi:hypothetical protein A7U60_g5171 [Sanghuangporus baumii]|uniref:Uncharacterized protein n=1 Tax=Sanghuangporus baumii TaxID=108892 RepID=A0A9Q5N3X0_SANBA|nr:hypothetical protein A7U60_g5171 [Sanghuangporus baumii]
MGRPLFSTLVARAAPVVRVAEPEEETKLPTYERWSYVNAFDPDSDEFFDGDNVVYEAFLSADDVAEQEREQVREGEGQEEGVPDVVRVPVSSQAAVRRRVIERLTSVEAPGEDERPELVSPTVDGSSSSGSDTASSGRASPTETDELLDASRAAQRDGMTLPWHPSDFDDFSSDFDGVPASSLSRSLPTTPTRASWLAESPVVFARPEELTLPMPIPPSSTAPVDIPTPASPMPQPAQAIPPSPMTPPGSTTPRFLSWGNTRGTRPHAIDMSPSPTPAGPFGSVRASRMTLSYISPPALRVQQ